MQGPLRSLSSLFPRFHSQLSWIGCTRCYLQSYAIVCFPSWNPLNLRVYFHVHIKINPWCYEVLSIWHTYIGSIKGLWHIKVLYLTYYLHYAYFLFFKLYYFYYLNCVSLCVLALGVCLSAVPRGIYPVELSYVWLCATWCWCWDLNQDLLQKQHLFSVAETPPSRLPNS